MDYTDPLAPLRDRLLRPRPGRRQSSCDGRPMVHLLLQRLHLRLRNRSRYGRPQTRSNQRPHTKRIDAAAQIYLPELNVQDQPHIDYPMTFVTAKAYLDPTCTRKQPESEQDRGDQRRHQREEHQEASRRCQDSRKSRRHCQNTGRCRSPPCTIEDPCEQRCRHREGRRITEENHRSGRRLRPVVPTGRNLIHTDNR